MKLGFFYRGVRSLVTATVMIAALIGAAPAMAMSIGLGDFVRFPESTTAYRVVGATLVDLNHVKLELEDPASGSKEVVTVDRSRTLEDVPGLIVLPQASRSLEPYM